jgi:DNA polymerase-3 subunit gamma/tau
VFENLIGQDELRGLLEVDLRGGRLPPSLLLSGPPASGKLTAALELARVLSCGEADPGAWNCACSSCARHRALVHPDLLLFGRRTFPEEIAVALETLGRAPGRAGSYFFIRAVRKLTKRFDPALFAGEEGKLSKAAPLVADLEERLAAVDPGSGGGVDDEASGTRAGKAAKAAKAAADIVPIAIKLEALVPDMPPVAQVRQAESWARLAPWGRRKTIIIENADAMHEGARNALLKILEEPPLTLTFILLSPRRSAMMRTILSRVRTYPFASRGPADSALVLEKVFRATGTAALEGIGPAHLTVAKWLASKRAFTPERARGLALSLVAAALGERFAGGTATGPALADHAERAHAERFDLSAALALVMGETKDLGQRDEAYAGSFNALLEGIDERLGEFLRAPELLPSDLAWIGRAADRTREARTRREGLNLQAGLLLEALAHELRQP